MYYPIELSQTPLPFFPAFRQFLLFQLAHLRLNITKLSVPRQRLSTRLVLLATFLFYPTVLLPAQSPDLGRAMSAQDAKAGTLLVRTSEHDQFRPIPMLFTEVEIKVTGLISRSAVTQHFKNPTDKWLEGTYVFPLPDTAAVDELSMKIGERIIVGEIEERAQAKKIYKKAKSEGKKATLVEQERPSIFTTSVANIGPGETIQITIEYQEVLRYDAGGFQLRFPTVVGPRYIPGTRKITKFSGTGWAHNTDEVADASRVTPPVAHPDTGPINPVRIRAHINAGFPVNVQSPSHAVRTHEDSTGTMVTLTEKVVPADSDFVLEWRPKVGDAPGAALFSDVFDGQTYVLLMVMPPEKPKAKAQRLPREAIYVIDTSGSMKGSSISQAKAALQLALTRLAPEDSFNVIEFNSHAIQLFNSSQPATPRNIRTAVDYVKKLHAGGGTEMMPALTLALGQSTTTGKVRQVIFVTDGSVGNEMALLAYIKHHLKRSRLFTVGIGSAPNGYFMRKAAEYGQGSFTYIGKISEVKTKMGELFAKLENPVLTRIRIDWKGRPVEHYPKYIPDLYLSEPVVIAARLPNLGIAPRSPNLGGSAEITGWLDGKPWAVDFTLDGGRSHSGIDRLFAQRKIEFLTSSLSEGIAHDTVRKAIVELGLTHHLVTKHTSLVAVEHVASRPKNEQLDSSAVPTNLPKGWVYDGVFGSRGEGKVEQAKLKELEEKTAANPGLRTAEKMTVATTKRYTTAQGPGVLPRTATPAALLLLIGLLLLVTAAWFWTRQPQPGTVALSTN